MFSKNRPRHDLKIWPKLGMRVIRIDTRPHDVEELFKRATTFRPVRLIGGQVAGEENRTKQRRIAALQVSRLIDDFRLPYDGISAGSNSPDGPEWQPLQSPTALTR